MVKIKNNKITITRGDTLETHLTIKMANGDEYVPAHGDEIRFALKSDYDDAEPLIIKAIPNDTLILRLESADTKLLEARPEPYVYDVQLTTPDGFVDTFIDRGSFTVTEEVD